MLLSACHLLVSLATTVRPVFLISIPAVQKVFNRITDASAQRLVDKVRSGLPSCRKAEGEECGLFALSGQLVPAQSSYLGGTGRWSSAILAAPFPV